MNENQMQKLTLLLKKEACKYNYDLLDLIFDDLYYIDEKGMNLLHVLVSNKYPESGCLGGLKTLLKIGLNPNKVDHNGHNFIQTAIETGYSEPFLVACINEAMKYGFKVNNTDSHGDTIIHTAILSSTYHDEISLIYKILCENGFDSKAKNNKDKRIDQIMLHSKKYNRNYKHEFIKQFNNQVMQDNKRKYAR